MKPKNVWLSKWLFLIVCCVFLGNSAYAQDPNKIQVSQKCKIQVNTSKATPSEYNNKPSQKVLFDVRPVCENFGLGWQTSFFPNFKYLKMNFGENKVKYLSKYYSPMVFFHYSKDAKFGEFWIEAEVVDGFGDTWYLQETHDEFNLGGGSIPQRFYSSNFEMELKTMNSKEERLEESTSTYFDFFQVKLWSGSFPVAHYKNLEKEKDDLKKMKKIQAKFQALLDSKQIEGKQLPNNLETEDVEYVLEFLEHEIEFQKTTISGGGEQVRRRQVEEQSLLENS